MFAGKPKDSGTHSTPAEVSDPWPQTARRTFFPSKQKPTINVGF